MRAIVPLLIVLSLLCLPAHADPVFYIGIDNGNQGEFENEGQADDHYYWENGNYSALGTGGGAWAGGQEIWKNSVADPLGFERALTHADTLEHIYFQLSVPEGSPGAEFTFNADLISLAGGSSHDLDFSMNGNVFQSVTGITSNTLVTATFLAEDVGANIGSNVITMDRVGGSSTGWIQFDYVSLDVAPSASPIPEPVTLLLAGIGLVGLRGYVRRRRAA